MARRSDHGDLQAILSPDAMAVIGASREPGSIGHHVFQNLLDSRFEGPVYPVNPKARSVCGVRAYPGIGQVPEAVDLAVIVVPAQVVPEVAEACGQAGVEGLVVISAGFSEIGAEGAKREAKLAEICQRYGMRVVGPNCMGVLNTDTSVRMNATFSTAKPEAGDLAFVSQSGALGMAILDMADELSLGLSYFVSLGNRMDVSSNDLLDVWADDDAVGAVILYLEHFGNPRNFIEVARRTTANKPVLAVKSGRSKAGARAARSHTGALAQPDVYAGALLKQCGIIRVDTIEEMFGHARVFARAPVPNGDRLAILTNSGGPGIMAVDTLEAAGLRLAELTEATRERLAEITVAEASLTNPVDLTAGGSPEVYAGALEALIDDPTVDALLVIYTPPTYIEDQAVVDALLAPDTHGKPLIACVMGRGQSDTAFHRLTEAGLPTFTFPESATRALGAYVRWSSQRDRVRGQIPVLEDVDREAARAVIHQADPGEDGWLSTLEGMSILEAYGIPVAEHGMAASAEAAARLVDRIGPPCVLKAQAPGLVHKTEVGGIVMDVDGPEAARDAWGVLEERLEAAGYELSLVLVQGQAPAAREIIMGVDVDPTFGPVILFGLGGIHVEVLADIVFRLAPLTDREAGEMVRSIRAWPLLEGVRGQAPADVEALEDILLRLSRLASDLSAIQELDLNPVMVGEEGEGAMVVDARIRLWPDKQMPPAPGRALPPKPGEQGG